MSALYQPLIQESTPIKPSGFPMSGLQGLLFVALVYHSVQLAAGPVLLVSLLPAHISALVRTR